jgi:hypothetical protein
MTVTVGLGFAEAGNGVSEDMNLNEQQEAITRQGIKKTIIDKTLTYSSETWTLTKRDGKQLNIFERKVYRRILGPVYDNEKRKLEDTNQ